jgi:formamidopyrimidine-DNA glycosylase
MLELPEALTIAKQMNDVVCGKRIASVSAARTPHKFAWYHGDPQCYHSLLVGRDIENANGCGGMLEVHADATTILVGDGVGLRYHWPNEPRPQKHQLLIEFEDDSAISASVQMYGGIWCFVEGDFDNPYYMVARARPSPLFDAFNREYFEEMISSPTVQKLSLKAFLATEQRIPGLGNGVLQDILYNVGIHPKKIVRSLLEVDKDRIFNSIKSTLTEMTSQGGRDTEKDLFGCPGGYKTKVSKYTVDQPCVECGGMIKKGNYLGGSIYFCEKCQKL